jgi:hypothetical protein
VQFVVTGLRIIVSVVPLRSLSELFFYKGFRKYSFLLAVQLTIAYLQNYAISRKDTTFKNSVKLKIAISEKKRGYPEHSFGSRQHTLTVTAL